MPQSLSLSLISDGVYGVGKIDLLTQSPTAFFSSRKCPGAAIRAAMSWAVNKARTKNPVISGFHSPLEQSVLKVLLSAESPFIAIICRRLELACLPAEWVQMLKKGNAAVISISQTRRRLTSESALRRNDWIAQRADEIVIAHASVDGNLIQQATEWELKGQRICYL